MFFVTKDAEENSFFISSENANRNNFDKMSIDFMLIHFPFAKDKKYGYLH